MNMSRPAGSSKAPKNYFDGPIITSNSESDKENKENDNNGMSHVAESSSGQRMPMPMPMPMRYQDYPIEWNHQNHIGPAAPLGQSNQRYAEHLSKTRGPESAQPDFVQQDLPKFSKTVIESLRKNELVKSFTKEVEIVMINGHGEINFNLYLAIPKNTIVLTFSNEGSIMSDEIKERSNSPSPFTTRNNFVLYTWMNFLRYLKQKFATSTINIDMIKGEYFWFQEALDRYSKKISDDKLNIVPYFENELIPQQYMAWNVDDPACAKLGEHCGVRTWDSSMVRALDKNRPNLPVEETPSCLFSWRNRDIRGGKFGTDLLTILNDLEESRLHNNSRRRQQRIKVIFLSACRTQQQIFSLKPPNRYAFRDIFFEHARKCKEINTRLLENGQEPNAVELLQGRVQILKDELKTLYQPFAKSSEDWKHSEIPTNYDGFKYSEIFYKKFSLSNSFFYPKNEPGNFFYTDYIDLNPVQKVKFFAMDPSSHIFAPIKKMSAKYYSFLSEGRQICLLRGVDIRVKTVDGNLVEYGFNHPMVDSLQDRRQEDRRQRSRLVPSPTYFYLEQNANTDLLVSLFVSADRQIMPSKCDRFLNMVSREQRRQIFDEWAALFTEYVRETTLISVLDIQNINIPGYTFLGLMKELFVDLNEQAQLVSIKEKSPFLYKTLDGYKIFSKLYTNKILIYTNIMISIILNESKLAERPRTKFEVDSITALFKHQYRYTYGLADLNMARNKKFPYLTPHEYMLANYFLIDARNMQQDPMAAESHTGSHHRLVDLFDLIMYESLDFESEDPSEIFSVDQMGNYLPRAYEVEMKKNSAQRVSKYFKELTDKVHSQLDTREDFQAIASAPLEMLYQFSKTWPVIHHAAPEILENFKNVPERVEKYMDIRKTYSICYLPRLFNVYKNFVRQIEIECYNLEFDKLNPFMKDLLNLKYVFDLMFFKLVVGNFLLKPSPKNMPQDRPLIKKYSMMYLLILEYLLKEGYTDTSQNNNSSSARSKKTRT